MIITRDEVYSVEYRTANEFMHKYGDKEAAQIVMILGIWCLRMREIEGGRFWLGVLKYIREPRRDSIG